MPERLQDLRRPGGGGRFSWRRRRNLVDRRIVAPAIGLFEPSGQLAHCIGGKSVVTQAVFEILQQPMLPKPVCDGAIRQARLWRDGHAETLKQTVEKAAFRRTVILPDPDPPPPFVPPIRNIPAPTPL